MMKNGRSRLIFWVAISAICLGCSPQPTAEEITAKSIQKSTQETSLSPSNLLIEGNKTPLNVHNGNANMSWHANVERQRYYQIQVATTLAKLHDGESDLWDSGKVDSSRSVNIPYQGKTLKANQRAVWRVRVWSDDAINPGAWSQAEYWEMGLLNAHSWQAKWIQAEQQVAVQNNDAVEHWMRLAADLTNPKLNQSKRDTQHQVLKQLIEQPTAALFRHDFHLDGRKIVKAKLHSTAAGYYEVYLNGRNVDDRIMDPGQTDFDQRILYNTDAVSDFLSPGKNTIAVHLGSGWYDENIAFSRWSNPDKKSSTAKKKSLSYGQPKFIAQLHVTYDDGSSQLIVSDESWLSHPSPIVKEGVFSGELLDANLAIDGWNRTGLEVKDWQPVRVLNQWPTKVLEPQLLPPIKAIKKLTPVAMFNPQANVWVFDFGQNFTGIPTIDLAKLNLSKDQAVYFRYGEWVDTFGNISLKSGGGAPLLKQVDGYIATGDEQGTWTPIFTWHGFRYVEVTGLQEQPALDAISAHLVRSDVAVAGTFESSDPLLNRIHDTALWGYESNLMALPMDCPIRERAGWTGDAHAALITGNYNYQMGNFWQKYLGDFKTAAYVAPAVVPGKRTHGGNFDWAAAEIIIAWEHYRHYGDLQLLQNQYPSMQEYMQAGEAKLENSLLRTGYGDWCDPVVKPGTPRVNGRCSPQHTTPTITSSALFAHTADLMANISTQLNKPEQANHYSQLFTRISEQFHQEFYDPKTSHYGSQTADAMAIMFAIAPEHLRPSIAHALNENVIRDWHGHASVGALGQTYLYRALSDFGYANTAFNIFKAKGYPGYDYMFNELNATTLWERKGFYDPQQDPDGTEAPGFSLNHPFHSGYDGWFYEGLGGIRPLDDSVGYQHFALQPEFVDGLDWVKVSYQTHYGTIKSHWQRETDTVVWKFTVPDNTVAYVSVPEINAKGAKTKKPAKYSAGQYVLQINLNGT
ncbi:family 78 glycoside hydrolase catalytic domain [Thalassotalea litorea]|nr:family 78 glycoside hydrolase catalytic domain [Thalassotalea litorea]